ncbi:hypothetical protein AB0F77_25945 [Streptomyces sp. NPDC026672]|uniref:hypothetical protein n=1 Tax=unclassified Streptomyces TaxID=2593676 RepID=UPI0033D93381
MNTRRRYGHLCRLLACSALLVGCGSQTGRTGGAGHPSSPVVTDAQAVAAVRAYEQGNNKVNAALDPPGLAAVETTPLRTSSQALMTVSRTLHQKIPHITHTKTEVFVPSGTGRTTWFLSVSQRVVGGVPSTQPTYNVFVRTGPSGSFRAAYALTPIQQEQVGPFALDAAGAAMSVTSADDLLLAPDKVGRAVTEHYVRGLSGKDAFLPSTALDDVLGNGYVLGRKVLGERGVTLTRNVRSDLPETYALRTTDGGVVAFTAITVTDHLTAKNAKSKATLRAGSNDAALFGRPGGAQAEKFTIDRLEMFMTYIPLARSGGKAKVLAYSEAPISVV